MRALVTPPFMHGAGHWVALRVWLGGGTVHLLDDPERLDPADVWRVVERERIESMLIVGDAFARPLVDELDRRRYDLASLNVVLSGGAALSVGLKRELLAHLPTVMIVDGLGSSEAGGQLSHVSTGDRRGDGLASRRGRGATCWRPTSTACSRPATRRSAGSPRAAASPSATSTTPTRRPARSRSSTACDTSIPGDRARLHADGSIELQGRDAVTINSGGEKIFAEEVELAVKAHPGVYDCVVAGRPSERWGDEVVAIVRPRDGRRRHRGVAAHARPPGTSPATSCRSGSCSSTRSSARRPARPTTAGPARSPPTHPLTPHSPADR